MSNTDRLRSSRNQPHQITIEGPNQIIQINSSYGSLLNQNFRMGPNRISISQNGQQISLIGGTCQINEYSYSLGSSCDFDINVSLGVVDNQSDEEEQYSEEEEEYASDTEEPTEEWSEINRGLTESEIDELPLYRYRQIARRHNHDSCSICLADMQVSHFVRVLPCVHLFHQQCIDKWLNKTNLCPLCKHRI